MEVLTTITARVLFSVPFIIFGIFHFIAGADLSDSIPQWIPGSVFWVYLTGAVFVKGGFGILLTVRAKLACLLLAFLMTFFTGSIHIPGIFKPDTIQTEMMNTLRNLIMIGGALAFAGMFGKDETAV